MTDPDPASEDGLTPSSNNGLQESVGPQCLPAARIREEHRHLLTCLKAVFLRGLCLHQEPGLVQSAACLRRFRHGQTFMLSHAFMEGRFSNDCCNRPFDRLFCLRRRALKDAMEDLSTSKHRYWQLKRLSLGTAGPRCFFTISRSKTVSEHAATRVLKATMWLLCTGCS